MITETYKKELLKKFVDNTISPKEYRLLELAALDDPFLFDALEGYSTIKDQKINTNSDQILLKIEKYLQKGSKRTMWIYLLAASLTGLIIFSSIFMWNNSPIQHTEMVNSTKTVNSIDEGVELNLLDTNFIASNDFSMKKARSENEKHSSSSQSSTHDANSIANQINNNDDEVEIATSQQRLKHPELPKASAQPLPQELNNAQTTDLALKSAEAKEQPLPFSENELFNKNYQPNNQLTIKGRVLDSDEQPLIGATVFTKSLSTITDIEGNFSLQVDSNESIITIDNIGYEAQKISITPQTINPLIKLKESSQLLDEVVYGVKTGASQKKVVLNQSTNLDDIFLLKTKESILKLLVKYNYPEDFNIDFNLKFENKRKLTEVNIINISHINIEKEIKKIIKNNMKNLPKNLLGAYDFHIEVTAKERQKR